MNWDIFSPDDDRPLHEEEQAFTIQPLDAGGLFKVTQSILAGPNGESRTVTTKALHVAGCNHLVGFQPGDLIGLCDLCDRPLCFRCANRLVCLSCLKRCCVECVRLIDGNMPFCPSCARTEKLKRFGSGLHRVLSREF